jgi:hypothetical protein
MLAVAQLAKKFPILLDPKRNYNFEEKKLQLRT